MDFNLDYHVFLLKEYKDDIFYVGKLHQSQVLRYPYI